MFIAYFNISSNLISFKNPVRQFITSLLVFGSPFLVALVSTSFAQELKREFLGEVMGTELKITAIGEQAEILESGIEAAVEELRRIENLMTDWRESPLLKLNSTAGSGPQKTPQELFQIIERGVEFGKVTGGAFDLTYNGVGKLWNFSTGKPVLPSTEEVSAALKFVSYKKVKLNPIKQTVALPKGFSIGLGGIAKGYGVDRAMDKLREHGIKNAIVNAGGDMKILGRNFGKIWEIAIKHPRERSQAMAAIRAINKSIVTSGDYERFFEIDGKRYHHIIDPQTGYPSKKAISATVVAPSAELGDVLATTLVVLGPKDGLKFIESLRGIEAIVVGMDGRVEASTGLRNAITPAG